MELFNLKYAVTVAETGNFTQAAEKCHVGQPALSQQIAKLESELGLRLFYRDAHSVRLTEAGEEFIRRARDILDRADALESAMGRYAGVRRGTVNLGIITSLECIGLSDRLSDFCTCYPEVMVNLEQAGSYDLLEKLADHRLHAVICILPQPNRIPKGLEYCKLGEDYFALCVPKAHRLAGKKSVSLKTLSEEAFIFHGSSQVAAALCLQACREAGFEPHIVCQSSNPVTDLYLVKGGLGITFLPTEEFESHLLKNVVRVDLEEKITKEVCMFWRKDDDSPLVMAVVDHAKQWNSMKHSE